MCRYTPMKTVRLKESLWEKLQKLKLKWRKKNLSEVIETLAEKEPNE